MLLLNVQTFLTKVPNVCLGAIHDVQSKYFNSLASKKSVYQNVIDFTDILGDGVVLDFIVVVSFRFLKTRSHPTLKANELRKVFYDSFPVSMPSCCPLPLWILRQ